MGSTRTRWRRKRNELQWGGTWCSTNKYCHLSMAAAALEAEAAMNRGQVAQGCHVEPYRCNKCGHYHIGNRKILFKD